MLSPNGKRIGRPVKKEVKKTVAPTPPPRKAEMPDHSNVQTLSTDVPAHPFVDAEAAAMQQRPEVRHPMMAGPVAPLRDAPADPEMLAMRPVLAKMAEERAAMLLMKAGGAGQARPMTQPRRVNRYRSRDRDPMIPCDEHGKDVRRPGFVYRLVRAHDSHGYEDAARVQEFQRYDYKELTNVARTRFGIWMEGPAEMYAERVLDKSVDGAFDSTLGAEKMMQSAAATMQSSGRSGNPVYIASNHGVTYG